MLGGDVQNILNQATYHLIYSLSATMERFYGQISSIIGASANWLKEASLILLSHKTDAFHIVATDLLALQIEKYKHHLFLLQPQQNQLKNMEHKDHP